MAISPPLSVPVTTVPNPATEKTRSTGNRGTLPLAAPGAEASTASSVSRSAGSPIAGEGGNRDDRRGRQCRGRDQLADLFAHEIEPVCLRDVGFGQDDDAAVDSKQIEDRQVLDSLGHGAFVGGDDEQRGVDAADAGEHVLDEPLVTGDVDDADALAAR